jgi:hypothetical protein
MESRFLSDNDTPYKLPRLWADIKDSDPELLVASPNSRKNAIAKILSGSDFRKELKIVAMCFTSSFYGIVIPGLHFYRAVYLIEKLMWQWMLAKRTKNKKIRNKKKKAKKAQKNEPVAIVSSDSIIPTSPILVIDFLTGGISFKDTRRDEILAKGTKIMTILRNTNKYAVVLLLRRMGMHVSEKTLQRLMWRYIYIVRDICRFGGFRLFHASQICIFTEYLLLLLEQLDKYLLNIMTHFDKSIEEQVLTNKNNMFSWVYTLYQEAALALDVLTCNFGNEQMVKSIIDNCIDRYTYSIHKRKKDLESAGIINYNDTTKRCFCLATDVLVNLYDIKGLMSLIFKNIEIASKRDKVIKIIFSAIAINNTPPSYIVYNTCAKYHIKRESYMIHPKNMYTEDVYSTIGKSLSEYSSNASRDIINLILHGGGARPHNPPAPVRLAEKLCE